MSFLHVPLFLSPLQLHKLMFWWRQTPWLLPTFQARACFSLRQVIAIVIACAWVYSDDAASLFAPGILVPVAAVGYQCRVCRIVFVFKPLHVFFFKDDRCMCMCMCTCMCMCRCGRFGGYCWLLLLSSLSHVVTR